MKTYNLDFSVNGISKSIEMLDMLKEIINDPYFLNYIGDKCKEALNTISINNLSSVETDFEEESSLYLSSNKLEINNDIIYLYNDSKVDISSKNMSETTKENYPAQLSLSKIVEFGIGYTGSIYADNEVDNWQYDVNNHGFKGWYYKDNNGNIFWTNGFEGKYIFLKLKYFIEKAIKIWIQDYFRDKIKEV